jgi:predicted secreted protein
MTSKLNGLLPEGISLLLIVMFIPYLEIQMMQIAHSTIDAEKISNQSTTNRTIANPPADRNPEYINLKEGESFVLSFQANPTTGYQWIPTYNKSIINLTSHFFKPDSKTLGTSGLDTFHFTGVSAGETKLEFEYKRSWEEKSAERSVFLVKVV